jgi:hypothetical protein
VSLLELTRLRRQFAKLTTLHQPSQGEIADAFAAYLNGAL